MDELKQGDVCHEWPLIEFKLGGEMVGSELKFDAAGGVPFTRNCDRLCGGSSGSGVQREVARELKLEGTRTRRMRRERFL